VQRRRNVNAKGLRSPEIYDQFDLSWPLRKVDAALIRSELAGWSGVASQNILWIRSTNLLTSKPPNYSMC